MAADLPVTFTGYLPDRPSLAGELAAAHIALVPGPVETFGLAALEALACGVPIIATAGAAPAELVAADPEAGRVVAVDPGAVADAVIDLLRVPAEIRRHAARATAERYPWSNTINRMLTLHTHVLNRPNVWAP